MLNFVLPTGGGDNGLHTEIRTVPVTVNAQAIQTVEFEAKFAETPTLHGQPALMGAGTQTIHYAVTGKLA